MISYEMYHVFCIVIEYGTFTGAAERLYKTQPAVSQMMAQLEELLGVRLFDRGARGVTPTREGKELYRSLKEGMNRIEDAEQRILRLKRMEEGVLVLGASDTISEHFLLPKLREYREKYPKIKLKLINRTSSELINLVAGGRVDIAFVNLPDEKSEAVNFTEIMEIHDVFIASDKFYPQVSDILEFSELSQYPLIMLENLAYSRRYVNSFLKSLGVELIPEFELGAHDLMISFAENGLGAACVIEEFARKALGKGDLYIIETKIKIPPRKIAVCINADATLSVAGQKLVEGI